MAYQASSCSHWACASVCAGVGAEDKPSIKVSSHVVFVVFYDGYPLIWIRTENATSPGDPALLRSPSSATRTSRGSRSSVATTLGTSGDEHPVSEHASESNQMTQVDMDSLHVAQPRPDSSHPSRTHDQGDQDRPTATAAGVERRESRGAESPVESSYADTTEPPPPYSVADTRATSS